MLNKDIDFTNPLIIKARANAYALLLQWREEDKQECKERPCSCTGRHLSDDTNILVLGEGLIFSEA